MVAAESRTEIMATGLRNIVLSIVTLLASLLLIHSSGFQSTHPPPPSPPHRPLPLGRYIPRHSTSRPASHG
ncbi:unnamed protein product [Linum trigynum]|uniref:Uncharacterized protein n=1 Tax=Linum trigynum TaxID=586398 RepID=A0AAV2F3W7_9ROSI